MNTDHPTEQRAAATGVLRKTDEERRSYPLTEIRATGGAAPKLGGYAAKFNELSLPLGGGLFREQIAAGFFKPALDRGDDVRLLINHQGLPLARSTNGTLRLWEDATGLAFEADLNASDPDAMMVLPKVQRGDLSQMSFSFSLPADGKGDTWQDTASGTIRTLRTIGQLMDIAVVTYPAYENSTVTTRKLQEAAARHRTPLTVAECRRKMAEQAARWGLSTPTRPVYAPSAVDRELAEIRARRDRLATRAARDPAMRFRTEIANKRLERKRAEGAGMPRAIVGPDGRLWSPE